MKSMDEVRRIKKRVERELLRRPGVTGVDVGFKTVAGKRTDTPSILVYVARKGDVTTQERLPAEIEGVPVDVIERTFKPM